MFQFRRFPPYDYVFIDNVTISSPTADGIQTVTGRSTGIRGVKNGIFFVRLQSGVNAKTKIFRGQEYPCKQDTVSFRVTKLDEDSLVANGYITRIIKRHTRLR